MAIPEMTDDLEIIEKLSDRPNQGNALSSAELKALFDKGPKLIKQFINSIMIPALNRLDGAASFKGGHEELTGRDAADQHPMAAIVGLVDALKAKAADKHNHNANEVNEGVLSTDRIPVVPVAKGGTGATNANDARENLGAFGFVGFISNYENNFNKCTTQGFYLINSTPTLNSPETTTGAYGILFVINSTYASQVAIYETGEICHRIGTSLDKMIAAKWRNALLETGGTMTGPVTLKGIHLTPDVDFGKAFPTDAKIGRIYWLPEVMEDV